MLVLLTFNEIGQMLENVIKSSPIHSGLEDSLGKGRGGSCKWEMHSESELQLHDGFRK